MARKRYQHGTVFLRGKHRVVWIGRWREDILLENGSIRRVLKSEVLGTQQEMPSKKLAYRELANRLTVVNSPTYQARPTATFAQFAARWQATVLSQHQPSTQSGARSVIRNRLLPFFGSLQMRDILPEIVQAFVSQQKGSPKTVRNIATTLRMMWNSAKAWQYVAHDCLDGIVLPKSQCREPIWFSIDEIKKILATAEEPHRTFYWIASETGMRSGELSALRVDDLDLENGLVHVRRSVWRGKFKLPKTHSGLRTFALSPALLAHLERFLNAWRPNANRLLFASSAGTPWDGNLLVKRKLYPLLDRLGLRRCGLHAFRHANSSMMDRLSVPMKVRQQRLGHSDARMTLGTYTHIASQDDRDFAQRMGELLGAGVQLFPVCSQTDEKKPPIAEAVM